MPDFSTARRFMVDGQIRPSSVTDWRIIDAMRAVPREAFVPDSQSELAYLDLDLDVSGPGPVKRYLLQPAVTARLLQSVNLQASDRVLVVGCATGYLAALAARMADLVVATECEPSIAAEASQILGRLGVTNVRVHQAPSGEGYAASAPYDVIILNGATEIVPLQLYQQLREAGRLIGVFALGRTPRAEIVTRSDDDFGSRPLFDTSAPVLPGLERPKGFVF
ncbi:protein-L-isoaspartate(D-aspartate) O-methyltransferase [Rhodopseudomonas rhenobacensis]|uniref:Protein-L-isoaspartate O-methyltransferase n=1 Tax=Rhodopseudomonas rhenobacensis TaxID=87461 RepID=A0A7W7Z7Z3_9BRAD|nr:protein-L-isoaspartate O-methyltransferase [Rhodopseudomonas rhenobacensis]MBB5049500.1 protein-L-isoaspartate(D-aspartate) O-methyltransferase [Rhodopseudomonas rhenobacensis]